MSLRPPEQKERLGRAEAEVEEKDFSGNEKGRQTCRPLRVAQSASRQLLPPPPFPSSEWLIAK